MYEFDGTRIALSKLRGSGEAKSRGQHHLVFLAKSK